jgi:hypothetical protein
VGSNTHYKSGVVKNRYLIKQQGVWKIITTWALSPNWDDDVTDVIWLKNDGMIASWWQMKDGAPSGKRGSEIVKDEELTFLLLQAQE